MMRTSRAVTNTQVLLDLRVQITTPSVWLS